MTVPLGSFQTEVASGYDHVRHVTVTFSPGLVVTPSGTQDVFLGVAERTALFERRKKKDREKFISQAKKISFHELAALTCQHDRLTQHPFSGNDFFLRIREWVFRLTFD